MGPLLDFGKSVRVCLAALVAYMDIVHAVSYAKINLTLEILSKRPDGFHEIDSVVQVVDLADELHIEEAASGTIVVEVVGDVKVPSGADNLVYKACSAFFRLTGVDGGAKCVLRKRIPAQSGLGGGSGNAATAIAALNRLYSVSLSRERLVEIASSVGSDVALFMHGGAVRMRGRGERINELPDGPRLNLVIVKPDAGVSTAWAYGRLDARGLGVPIGASDRAEAAIRAGDRATLLSCLMNEFDGVVAESLSCVSDAKNRLLAAGAEAVLLAGSGSAVFGVFADRRAAERARDELTRDLKRRATWQTGSHVKPPGCCSVL